MNRSATLTGAVTLFMGTVFAAEFSAGTRVFVGAEHNGKLHVAYRGDQGLIYTGWVAADLLDYGGEQT